MVQDNHLPFRPTKKNSRTAFPETRHPEGCRSFRPPGKPIVQSLHPRTTKKAALTLSTAFLSLLSDSNQRPRDYKSRALAN